MHGVNSLHSLIVRDYEAESVRDEAAQNAARSEDSAFDSTGQLNPFANPTQKNNKT